MTIDLRHGDCREVLKTLADNSVDSCVTDPPYGIDYQSARRSDTTKRLKKIANDKTPFIWFLPEVARVLKDGAGLVCFCRWDVQEQFRMAIECAGLKIRSHVIWDRDHHGMGSLRDSFAPQHDVVWFATKGRFAFPGKRPRSVVRSKRISGDKLVHPNEKPVDLMESFVMAITPPGGVVLDPFLGSGTTAVACKNLGYSCVGIEQNAEYLEIAKARVAA